MQQKHAVTETVEPVAAPAQQTHARRKTGNLPLDIPERRPRQVIGVPQLTRITQSQTKAVGQRVVLTPSERPSLLGVTKSPRHGAQITIQSLQAPPSRLRTRRKTRDRTLKVGEGARHTTHVTVAQSTKAQGDPLIVTPQTRQASHLLLLSGSSSSNLTTTLRISTAYTLSLLAQGSRMHTRHLTQRRRLLPPPALQSRHTDTLSVTQRRRLFPGLEPRRRNDRTGTLTRCPLGHPLSTTKPALLLRRSTPPLSIRLTRSSRSLPLTSQLFTMRPLCDSTVTADLIVQPVEIETSTLQLPRKITELISRQLTRPGRITQITRHQPHRPAHEVHLVARHTTRALKLPETAGDTMNVTPEPLRTVRRQAARLRQTTNITVHAMHTLTDLVELAPRHIANPDG